MWAAVVVLVVVAILLYLYLGGARDALVGYVPSPSSPRPPRRLKV